MKPFRVTGELKPQTLKALGPFTKWDAIVSRITLPTEGDEDDGFHPVLVNMVSDLRRVDSDAEKILSFGSDLPRELRREVGAKWAEVCGVGAAHGDTVLFQHIASIMAALDRMDQRKQSGRFLTVYLVRLFARKNQRLPYPSEIAAEISAMGGNRKSGALRKLACLFWWLRCEGEEILGDERHRFLPADLGLGRTVES